MHLNKKLAIRVFIVFIGIYIMTISFSMFYWANMGSDPVSVLVEGLSKTLNITYGIASTCVNLILFIIVFIFNKRAIGIATVISVLFTGVFLNFNMDILFRICSPDELSYAARVLIPIIASVINCASLGLYLSMDLGASAFDGVVLTVTDKMKVSYKSAMYLVNGMMFCLGVAQGGVWGYATIVSLLLSGILFERFLKAFRKVNRELVDR